MEEFVCELSAQELVDRYSAMIYRIAFVRLQNVHDAEDITQEVLLRYIRSKKKFRDEEHRKAWLLKVTSNAVNSLASSAWRRHTVPLDEASEMAEAGSENEGRIAYAVAQLPEAYIETVHLFYFENYSIKQISKITGKAEGTIKSQLSRARVILKEILTEGEQHVR